MILPTDAEQIVRLIADLADAKAAIKTLAMERNAALMAATEAQLQTAAVFDDVAEMIDEERENTFSGQPYFVLLAKKVRAMKGAR